MVRPDKAAAVTEVRERLESSTATVLTEYRGLTVSELAELRAELRKSGAEYKVVKNTLTKIAARDAGVDIPDELLVGPTAVTFVTDDPVAAAKVLRAFSKDHPALVVKGGILEGRSLDAAETMRLADLASREELLAKLAGMLGTILAQPARLAQANLAKAARLLGALHAKWETEGAPGGTGEPEAAAEEAPAAAEDAPAEDAPAAEAAAADDAPAADEAEPAAEAEAPADASADEASADEAPTEETPDEDDTASAE